MKAVKPPKQPNNTSRPAHRSWRWRRLGETDAYGVKYQKGTNGVITRISLRTVDQKRMARDKE
jgi:hypothetical protein